MSRERSGPARVVLDLFRSLVSSGALLFGGAAALSLFWTLALGMSPSWQPQLLLLSYLVLIYGADAMADVAYEGKPAKLHLARPVWAVLGVGILALVLRGPVAVQLGALVYLPSGLLYGRALPAGGQRRVRPRDIPGLKAPAITLAVVGLIAGLPLAYAPRTLSAYELVLLAGVAWVVLTNTLLGDVRDAVDDRRLGSRTLPVVFGVRRVRGGLAAGNLVAGVALAVGAGWCPPDWTAPSAALAVTAFTHAVIALTIDARSAHFDLIDGVLCLPVLTWLVST